MLGAIRRFALKLKGPTKKPYLNKPKEKVELTQILNINEE